MEYRIRVAAIITKGDEILLIKNLDPESGFEWWAPPGGGLEDIDKNIHECAVRETWEETGYNIETSDILYIREFLTSVYNSHNLEIFLKGKVTGGSLCINNPQCPGHQDFMIDDVQWIKKSELHKLNVYPEVIKEGNIWKQLEKQVYTEYLGRKRI